MAANKDKQYDAVVCTGRQMALSHTSATAVGLLDQAGLLDRRMQLEPQPWRMAYG